jgi:hypothetical protein
VPIIFSEQNLHLLISFQLIHGPALGGSSRLHCELLWLEFSSLPSISSRFTIGVTITVCDSFESSTITSEHRVASVLSTCPAGPMGLGDRGAYKARSPTLIAHSTNMTDSDVDALQLNQFLQLQRVPRTTQFVEQAYESELQFEVPGWHPCPAFYPFGWT